MSSRESKILHIMVLDKFIPPFIDFISENMDISKHTFLLHGQKTYRYGLTYVHPDNTDKSFKLWI